ncbi:MAG: cation diffusion facilitator family transporter [Eubacteriales bacterium]
MKNEKEHHRHTHSHSHHQTGSEKNILFAFVLNLVFAIIEAAGGIWTNSIAILSDALHDFGDALSLGVAWVFQKKSKKQPDHRFSFGYARFSLLGALISSFVLVAGSALILSKTIPRLFQPEHVQPKGMLIFAVLGILVNGVAIIRLNKGTSINEKVVSWHLLEDALGWVAVLVASIVLMFWDIPWIDPVLSLMITGYVLFGVFRNLKEIFIVFLQGIPDSVDAVEIEKQLTDEIDTATFHHIHLWSLDGEKTMMSLHMNVSNDLSAENIIKVKQKVASIAEGLGIHHLTIQVDFMSENCQDREDKK